MNTNTLRVTLQHTMDNVVSQHVPKHVSCVASHQVCVDRQQTQALTTQPRVLEHIRSVNKAELESVTDS